MTKPTKKSLTPVADFKCRDGFPVIVVTHPRSGTHLTIDLLRRNFDQLKSTKPPFAPLDALYVALDVFFLESASPASQTRAIKALAKHRNPIIKSHWIDPEYQSITGDYASIGQWLQERGRVIYVVRNPENVLASTFLFEQGFLEISGQAARSAWLLQKAAYWVQHVTKWTARQNLMILRFEDIVKDTDRQLQSIGEFLDLPVNTCSSRLPPRMNGKWAGRLSRLRTNPPTTEILNLQNRTTLEKLFDPKAVSDCREIIATTAEAFGYRQHASTGSV